MSYELKVERLIDATPEEVFDAYTDPVAQQGWFTILNEGMIVENEVDLRVGGNWVSRWGSSPEEMYGETQTFVEIDRPHRLVTKSTGTSPDGASIDTHVEITFREDGGKTLMTIVQTGFTDESVRDFFAERGWNGLFDRLNAYFAAKYPS